MTSPKPYQETEIPEGSSKEVRAAITELAGEAEAAEAALLARLLEDDGLETKGED
jgi:hypothetical protein